VGGLLITKDKALSEKITTVKRVGGMAQVCKAPGLATSIAKKQMNNPPPTKNFFSMKVPLYV
jgi:hypothetical protein